MANAHSEIPAPVAPAERSLIYSICPVFVASHVAVEFGWLDEELSRVGAGAHFLRSLPEDLWPIHFTHRHDSFFRDGGAIPAIWAHAEEGPTVLLGLTAAHNGGQIVVRADDDIHSLGDLRGRRIGLPRNPGSKIDWWRAVSQRAFRLSLRLGGVVPDEVTFIDIGDRDLLHATRQSAVAPLRPRDVWAALSRTKLAWMPEIAALERGDVDAVYTGQGKALFLERSGVFKVIEDLSRRPDWTLEVANSPFALTASRAIAEQHPDIVVAYLRAAIRAGRWINANKAEAAVILHDLTYHPTVADTHAAIAGNDFILNLSPQNLAGIGLAKRSLRELGYIDHDFEVVDWADPRFLQGALASLPDD